MRKIKYIIVHHSGRDGSTVESIRRTHQLQFKWFDIGYHRVVYDDGTVHRGRPDEKPGAHVAGFNRESMGVCLSGNLNKRPPAAAQYAKLIDELVDLCFWHSLPADAVLGHRETRTLVPKRLATRKSCPGLFVDMDQVRADVAARMGAR